jgi:REP element-mobilizing transposase RayT
MASKSKRGKAGPSPPIAIGGLAAAQKPSTLTWTHDDVARMPGRWIHFVETMYGCWLYGDPRGFRTRHHREHVEGDYKRPPPPGRYIDRCYRSRASLKQPPVTVPIKLRAFIGTAIRERLEQQGAFVLCLAVSGKHLHLLAKLPPRLDDRDVMGIAKKHTTFEMRKQAWKGKLWAKRGKELAVRTRKHHQGAYWYILRHASEGAYVWDWRAERKKHLEAHR